VTRLLLHSFPLLHRVHTATYTPSVRLLGHKASTSSVRPHTFFDYRFSSPSSTRPPVLRSESPLAYLQETPKLRTHHSRATGEAKTPIAIIMSSKQQPTEPNFGAIIGDSRPIEQPPRRRARRQKKDKSLPEASQGADNRPSQSSSYRPIAKRPTSDTQQPNRMRQSTSIYSRGKPPDQKWTGSISATHSWLSHLEKITSLGVAISQITRKVKSAILSAVTQPLYELNVETLLQQSEYLQQSYLELKESVQQSVPSLTCPWRSHFDRINSLALEISRVAWDLRTTTSQLLLQVDVQTLLQQSEDLHKSYFDLKECIQQPMLSLGGGQSSELTTTHY